MQIIEWRNPFNFSSTTCAERSLLCGLSLSIQEQRAVEEAVKNGIISLADVLEKNEIMKNKEILEQHEQFCSIWKASDGRFKTKLPDESKANGKKLVAKTSREDLEKYIIKYYKGRQEQKANPRTMKALYPEWLQYKAADTSNANANKLQWVWNTYFANSDIAVMDMQSIDVITLKTWFLNVIEKHKLSSKKYKEMKSVANMLFDYAVEKKIVTANISRSVHGISAKKFFEPNKKAPAEQVYVDNEIQLILEQAEKQYKKTNNSAYLAVCLNFSLGLRVGELVALKLEDFSESCVEICGQEIKEYYTDVDSKLHRSGYCVVSYTKTIAGKRKLYLSERAKKYLHMILHHNECKGFDSKYLLLDKNGDRLHEYSVNNVLRRLNRQIDTIQKGNHSIRKTLISKMIESNELTNEEIRTFAGHEDFSTTAKFYNYSTVSWDKRADAFEKALG